MYFRFRRCYCCSGNKLADDYSRWKYAYILDIDYRNAKLYWNIKSTDIVIYNKWSVIMDDTEGCRVQSESNLSMSTADKCTNVH